MFGDPRQFLLLHVEKIVFAVMVVLLVLVIAVYQPWSIEVPEKAVIKKLLDDGRVSMAEPKWDRLPEVPDYVQTINEKIDRPWPRGAGPQLLDPKKLVFFNIPRGRWVPRAPEPPPVVRAAAVYAKADKGQAVIVFRLNDLAQQQALDRTMIQEYLDGLEWDHIEIRRIDKGTGEKTLITPKDWLPTGLPSYYGVGSREVGAGAMRERSFGEPVYLFAQRAPSDPGQEDEWRQMEEERRRRALERRQLEMELRRRAEQELKRREAGGARGSREPTVRPRTPPTRITPRPTIRTRPIRTIPVRPRTTPTTVTTPSGWYYFIDRKVAPDTKYEYQVIIYCKNPIFGAEKSYDTKEVKEIVQSELVSTSASNVVEVESYKKWYFKGGSISDRLVLGTFNVRSFVGGRKEITADEINQIVKDLSTPIDERTRIGRKKPVRIVPEGVWVEQNFTVHPGEEIGRKTFIDVGGEKREVDFGTGCIIVSIENDVQVVEEQRTVIVPGEDGKVERVKRVRRVVYPRKLRVAYVDRKGNLKTRWEQVTPPLDSTPIPE